MFTKEKKIVTKHLCATDRSFGSLPIETTVLLLFFDFIFFKKKLKR